MLLDGRLLGVDLMIGLRSAKIVAKVILDNDSRILRCGIATFFGIKFCPIQVLTER